MKIDQYHRRIFCEEEICNILYRNKDINLADFNLSDPGRHNAAIKTNYSDLSQLNPLSTIDVTPDQWHLKNQQTWNMPEQYQQFDIAQWVLDQCNGDFDEIQRAGAELLVYAERNLLDMLRYLKYLVDVMQENNTVWGVGRGSSVASFVLYKIGVHSINSLYYDLDFEEFMR